MSLPKYPEYKDSGVEWLGRIPGHWGIRKFRHSFRESHEKIEGDIIGQMLSVSGYRGIEIKEYDDENRRRTDEELQGYRVVRPGQLVVNTMWLSYAGLGVSEHEGHVSPAYRSYWIEDGLDGRFVHHMMRCGEFVKGYTKFLTGIRPNSLQMSRDDLMEFRLADPPIDEQQAIATFLDRETAKIDALIAEQEKLLALLAEKRQATISHAVTRGLNPNVPMKDSGIPWLGEVPLHWNVVPLKYLVSFKSGGTPSKDTLEYWDGLVPWASAKDMKSESLSNTTDHLTQFAVESGAATLLPAGVVVVVVRGMILARTFPVVQTLVPMAINQDLKALLPHKELDHSYLAWLLRGSSAESLQRLDEAGHGTKALRMDAWGSMAFPVPPLAEQHEIAESLSHKLAAVDELAEGVRAVIELLKERRSTLISAAVTGKIDVRGLVAEAA